MEIYYKLILLAILIYFCIYVVNEKFTEIQQQNFSIPKTKIKDVMKEQGIHKKKHDFMKFNIEDSINTGQGVHDRIRYDGKWD